MESTDEARETLDEILRVLKDFSSRIEALERHQIVTSVPVQSKVLSVASGFDRLASAFDRLQARLTSRSYSIVDQNLSSASSSLAPNVCVSSDVVVSYEESSTLDCCCENVPAVLSAPAPSVPLPSESAFQCLTFGRPQLLTISHGPLQLIAKGTIFCRERVTIQDPPAPPVYLASPELPLPPPEPPPYYLSRCLHPRREWCLHHTSCDCIVSCLIHFCSAYVNIIQLPRDCLSSCIF